ncbi:MAG TPA: threonine synthase [Asticcacaulis sp.]
MNYIGTRGFSEPRSFAGALLDGLAPDGGLYVPQTYPQPGFDLAAAAAGDYGALTEKLLTLFGVDVLGAEAVTAAAARTKAAFLRMTPSGGQTPLTQLDDNLWLLELYHGPTLAFKDMAMQMIAPLTDAALAQTGEKLTLVTATSGDTGAAAVRAFAGSAHVRLVVFHPLGRVSPVQRLQMTTVDADNVLNVGVEGDFDDCQRIVKRLLGEASLKERGLISSVNSINWGRLLGQVPYYLAASAASGADRPDFVAPTGNFGDAFAGWVARRIGGPKNQLVGDLHAAVNSNDALALAVNTGHYLRRPAVETASVSMDVQAPSNFERLVFEASGRHASGTQALFNDFNATGDVRLSPDLQNALQAEVSASRVDEATTKATIKTVYERYGKVICPHTAVAVAAAMERGLDKPQIALATAHPAKFPGFVTEALGFAPEVPEAIAKLHGQKETIRDIRNDEFAALEVVKAFAH